MLNLRKKITIKSIIIVFFIIAMLVSVSFIGAFVFINWFTSAKQATETLANEITDSINSKVESFLSVPELIIDTNHKIISNGILDLSDAESRDKFFVSVLSSQNAQIYSFSYGSENGEFYGARRNESNTIEIIRNNTSTDGNSWYYSVNEDMTAGNLVMQAGKFDPRTRVWYKVAVTANGAVFSPVYKHFIMNDLTISFASPIFNKSGDIQGVLGTHMLLTDIGAYLDDLVGKYEGYAIVLEKNSNNLIANSMGIPNFNSLQDGSLIQLNINEVENLGIRNAVIQYNNGLRSNFSVKGNDNNFYVSVQELEKEGLNWVVISLIPDSYLITPVVKNIQLTVLITLLILLFSVLIFYFITGRLFHPIRNLLQSSDDFSSGDLTKRVEIIRNDEIGIISKRFNNVADKMQFLINNLEDAVKMRTMELNDTNISLEENKNELRLILDSSAEGIYGIDLNGNCTFCNLSCIEILGYTDEKDLLGKNMHDLIHYKHQNGTNLPVDECRIYKALKNKKGTTVDDEVFWKSDGTSFYVEYHSFPQIKDGQIVGAVITFMDVTARKQRESEIQYLNYHDILTGLFNRRYFEDNRTIIDKKENLPISIIFADINGLKMTNDIFGHAAGDKLIKKSAEILIDSCRQKDLVARIGGDEFIIICPNTDEENVNKIIKRIRDGFLDARLEAIKCSISIGYDTKKNWNKSIEEVISNAENAMYKDKTINRKSINTEIIDALIETLHSKSTREMQHSISVSELCGELGYALELPEPEISKLKRAAYLHDIGKIVIDDELLTKDDLLEEEYELMRQHSVTGYRILNLFDDTVDLAEYVYGHHERWDGAGYPRGLKGEDIPMLSRIISVVETYDRVLNRGSNSKDERKKLAYEVIKEGVSKQFDPLIVEKFILVLNLKEHEI